MEEFDKWNMKQPEELPSLKERGHSSLLDAIRKQGWKAALKWALTQDTDLNATELAYAIEKELGED